MKYTDILDIILDKILEYENYSNQNVQKYVKIADAILKNHNAPLLSEKLKNSESISDSLTIILSHAIRYSHLNYQYFLKLSDLIKPQRTLAIYSIKDDVILMGIKELLKNTIFENSEIKLVNPYSYINPNYFIVGNDVNFEYFINDIEYLQFQDTNALGYF